MATFKPWTGAKFNISVAMELCERRCFDTLKNVCKADDMPPYPMVWRWLSDTTNPETLFFRTEYEKSCLIFYERMAEEIFEIADDSTRDTTQSINEDGTLYTRVNPEVVARAKLRIDARWKYLSKVLPMKYGDRTIIQGDKNADAVQFSHRSLVQLAEKAGALEDGEPRHALAPILSAALESGTTQS